MRSHLAFLLAVFSGASASLLQGTLLNRAVGQNVSFEAPVFVRGFLQLDGLTIAEVMSGKETDDPPPRLKGRLTWDSQTGLFKISNLNPEDRGVYKVENFGGEVPVMVTFTLEVYDPVSLPQVRVTSHDGTCFLECSVKNGREVTLLLKSRGKTLSHTVDPDLNAPLILHRVTEELSESYSCVASNPASNKSVTAHPDQYCAGPQKVELTEGDSFSFQAPVRQEGSLTYRDLGRITQVSAGKMSPVRVESFRDRVTWDRTTGLFSISKLETGDSGEYTVEVKDEGRIKFLLSIQKAKRLPTWAAILITILVIALVAALVVGLGVLFRVMCKSVLEELPEGESFIVPFPVKRNGEFRHSAHGLIATVSSGKSSIEEKYKNRVTWDSCTGLLTIQHLEKGDAGVYTVKDKDTKKNSKMHLSIMSDNSEDQNVSSTRSSSHSPEKENLLPGEVTIPMDGLEKTSCEDNSVL